MAVGFGMYVYQQSIYGRAYDVGEIPAECRMLSTLLTNSRGSILVLANQLCALESIDMIIFRSICRSRIMLC